MTNSKPITEAKVKADIRAKLCEWKALGRPISWFWPLGGAFGKSGVEDLVLCVNGQYVAVEVKRPGGKLTPLQRTRRDAVQQSNGIAICARDVDYFIAVVEPLFDEPEGDSHAAR